MKFGPLLSDLDRIPFDDRSALDSPSLLLRIENVPLMPNDFPKAHWNTLRLSPKDVISPGRNLS
jgi:hypothetical protein